MQTQDKDRTWSAPYTTQSRSTYGLNPCRWPTPMWEQHSLLSISVKTLTLFVLWLGICVKLDADALGSCIFNDLAAPLALNLNMSNDQHLRSIRSSIFKACLVSIKLSLVRFPGRIVIARCRSEVPQWGASVRCISEMPQWGASGRCPSEVPQWGVSVRCLNEVPQ